MSLATRVYKLLHEAAWREAQANGVFHGAAIDLEDGYIHLSTAAQAQETARLHFRNQQGLIALELAVSDLKPGLKWEPSRGGQLFPHLYTGLDPAWVKAEHPCPLGDDGAPTLPPLTP